MLPTFDSGTGTTGSMGIPADAAYPALQRAPGRIVRESLVAPPESESGYCFVRDAVPVCGMVGRHCGGNHIGASTRGELPRRGGRLAWPKLSPLLNTEEAETAQAIVTAFGFETAIVDTSSIAVVERASRR